ncbi:DUF6415 family natural product biosynthesis protein [Streptomyces sp. GQFP]|uniref:DUF6415 family natural product biosynthesis protein n=1 Tax=Streptomyces sp. GQFP TaxID=2907545 RepID=UPI001F37CB90|nr:DUF6415 family natural product biosynthesis protein [Streptomyces sp. GQFP]UIX30222.1 DUF6415 family natural product biosynthesis protein [Streptomyces sp. GQFP]
MSQATTPTSDTAGDLPLDIESMRSSALRLMGPEAQVPPSDVELATLTLTLRGHLKLLVPEVESVARKLSEDDVPRPCALVCAREARQRLSLPPGLAHARRISRSVNALCDHMEALS